MRTLTQAFFLSSSLAVALAMGCSEGGTKGVAAGEPGPDRERGPEDVTGVTVGVETAVEPASVAAGSQVSVTCTALDESGGTTSAGDFELVIEPMDGLTVEGMVLTPTLAGSFTVACKLTSLIDESPVEVLVTAGAIAKTEITLEPDTVEAGGSSSVSCEAWDAHGNEVDGAAVPLTVDPGGPTLSEGKITTEEAGVYEVTCAAAGAEEQGSATWTVTPGAPVSFSLVLSPEPKAYGIDQAITVSGVGADALGNPLEGMLVTDLKGLPDGSHFVFGEGQKIRFVEEGFFTVSAASADDPSLVDTRDIVVDQSPPEVTITSPERGYAAEGITEVLVEGTVSDNLGVVSWLKINGNEFPLPAAEGGAFSMKMPLAYGMNRVHVEASDPYDNLASSARSALWSDGWYALAPGSLETDGVPDGALFELSQQGVDDGDHTEEAIDDLAHVLAQVVEGLDLSTLIDNPISSSPCIGGDCTLSVSEVSNGGSDLSLTLMDGGIHVELDITDFYMEFTSHLPGLGDLPGGFTAEYIHLEMDLKLDLVAGVLESSVSGIKVEIGDTEAVFFEQWDLGIFDDFINGALDFIEPFVKGLFETVLPFVLQGLIEDTINGLTESLAIDTEFEIPALVQGALPNVLALETELTELLTTPQYLRIGFEAVGYAKAPIYPHEVPGSIKFSGCGPSGTIPVPPPAPLVAGLHDELINQLLYGIWDGGTLSLDLGGEALAEAFDLSKYGVELSHIAIDPLLPIVVNSCGSGENRAQIGDLYLDATLSLFGQPSHIVVWLQAEAILGVTTGEGDEGQTVLGFEIGEFDPVLIDVVTNEGVFEGDDAGLIELVGDQMLPLLIGELAGDQLTFDLPQIDLNSLSSDIPEGTVLNLDLQTIGRSGAYLTAEGGLK